MPDQLQYRSQPYHMFSGHRTSTQVKQQQYKHSIQGVTTMSKTCGSKQWFLILTVLFLVVCSYYSYSYSHSKIEQKRGTSKYHERNKRVRRKFQSSLDKIQQTCLKYSANNSSKLPASDTTHFSLGKVYCSYHPTKCCSLFMCRVNTKKINLIR